MEIRINTLTLHNFKGVRSATFYFEGGNARIEGENGTGKSTVFDAFTWLLFGKDHRGQDWTNFEIKPIDPQTREPLHGLSHWVEAHLTIDGVNRTLRREFVEEWTKPKGEADKVFKGHKQSFFIDGVDTATKKAYDAAIGQWINEGVFKLITNPLYFIDDTYTDWKTRRKGLMSLVDGRTDEGLGERFADLLAEMRGEPMDQFRKRIAAEKKANKESLARAEAHASAYRDTLPKEVNEADVKARIAALEGERDAELETVAKRVADIDAGIADINAANSGKLKQVDAIRRDIIEICRKEREMIDAALSEARENEARRKADLSVARLEVTTRRSNIAGIKRSMDDLAGRRDRLADDVRELGKSYQEEKDEAFEYTASAVCPTCGQPLPGDILQEREDRARELFIEEKKRFLAAIVNDATEKKEIIAKLNAQIAELAGKKDREQALLDEAEKAIAYQEGQPAVNLDALEKQTRLTPAFVALAKEHARLDDEAAELASQTVSMDALLTDRRGFERDRERIAEEYARRIRHESEFLTIAAERARILDMIAEAEGQARVLSDEVARLERLEFRAQEYVKAEIDGVEAAINGLFRDTRWRMFETTIEGGIVETCEATSLSGVPYGSMNDAQRIICGMDVIRVFSERVGCRAPIFVDNAESVTLKDFGTPAQVIRLVVAEGRKELTTIKE